MSKTLCIYDSQMLQYIRGVGVIHICGNRFSLWGVSLKKLFGSTTIFFAYLVAAYLIGDQLSLLLVCNCHGL
jgi:hypothetical protein